jgi:hypothetical protein
MSGALLTGRTRSGWLPAGARAEWQFGQTVGVGEYGRLLGWGNAATDMYMYNFRAVGVNVIVNLFLGLLAWVVFVVLEPLLVWLGTRRERRRNRSSSQARPGARGPTRRFRPARAGPTRVAASGSSYGRRGLAPMRPVILRLTGRVWHFAPTLSTVVDERDLRT